VCNDTLASSVAIIVCADFGEAPNWARIRLQVGTPRHFQHEQMRQNG
jgi:hypothetical protein